MGTKLKIRTPEGVKEVGISDVRPYWLYDTISLGTALPAEDFWFQNPSQDTLGNAKLLSDTNLRQFSTIQVGWTLEVNTIRIIPQQSILLPDAETIFDRSVVTFLREGDIEIFSLPAVMLNAGCGIYSELEGDCSASPTCGGWGDSVSLGVPASGAVLKLPIRFLLYGGETFLFRIQFANSTAALSATNNNPIRLRMSLDGILKRGVRGA